MAVVMRPLAHIMILASAGSGKTYALTNRFVELLARGAAAERIVALTFTRASWYHAQRASSRTLVDRDVEPARRAGANAQSVAGQRATVRHGAARDRQIRLGVRQEPDLTAAPLRNHLAHPLGGALGVKQPAVEQQRVDAGRAVPLQKLHDMARDRRVALVRKPERNQSGARLWRWVRAGDER